MCQYSSVQTVGRPQLHAGRIGLGEHAGAAVGADVLRVMADQAVTLAGHTVLHLAGGGELEALLHAALRLELGHFRLLLMSIADAPRQPYQPGDPSIEGRAYRGKARPAQSR